MGPPPTPPPPTTSLARGNARPYDITPICTGSHGRVGQMEIEFSKREVRLMRWMRLVGRLTLMAAAVLWLLASAFPPPRPPPREPPSERAPLSAPPGCLRSLATHQLHGRAICYDQTGHPLFREVAAPSERASSERASSDRAPSEMVHRVEALTRR